MKKRLLSIITSVSLLTSAFSLGANAAPSLAGVADTATDFLPVPEIVEETPNENYLFEVKGPGLVTVSDSAYELNTEFGTPELWEGASLMADLSGEGTEESPYLIGNADELFLMSNNVNSGIGSDAYYKLTADIDLGGAEWTPIGYVTGSNTSTDYSTSFMGSFDGDGHTVSNFEITKDNTAYLGLFGYVVNGTIKNLNVDNAVIDVDSTSVLRLYVSPLAGRIVSRNKNSSTIENCHVTSSSVTVTSNGTIYAGGISGSIISDENEGTEILVAFSSADCDFNIVTNATTLLKLGDDRVEYQIASVGGISGFLSAGSDSTITVINCSAKGNSYSEASAKDYMVSSTMCGGAFGDIRTVNESGIDGKLYIKSCYSEGEVKTTSGFSPYVAGGFAGQIYATNDLYISDCYSSANISALFHNAGYYVESNGNVVANLDPSAGGFVGQLFFDNYITSYGKTIKNCYASGDVVDLGHTETTPKDYSFVGGFMGWSTSGVFENCFRFEAQNVVGSDLNYSDFGNINVLSAEESKYVDKYTGFDMVKTWEMNPEAEYFYPTLRAKTGYVSFVSEGNIFATDVFGADGKISAPSGTPTKAMTVDKAFNFNYWSLSENGTPFNFSSDKVSENATLYAVFSSVPRPYKVTFINDGAVYGSAQTLNFGELIKAPSGTPVKEETETYYYEFLYWSDAENGEKYIFDDDSTVVGNMTFYAVYEKIDKTAWRGEIAEEFSSGFGTEALPYVITTGEEFALFAKVINEQQEGYTDAYFALGNDINLGGNYWVPVGNSKTAPFSAHFDGNGYSVGNFKVIETQFAGLFGYVFNGTIKNVYVKNFTINISPEYDKDTYITETDTEGRPVNISYVGGLAGCIDSKRGTSEISGVRVTAVEFKVDASFDGYVYVGNIAGFAKAQVLGNILIHDSFATNDITVNNTVGYSYVGGITGRLQISGNAATALISRCYYSGSLRSTSYHSSYAGGLVGYLYSSGSAYVSSSGTTSSDDSASLSAEDVDYMITDSFAIPNIYSNSTGYYTHAGYLVASINTHASYKNIFYPDTRVMINPEHSDGETEHGYETNLSNLMSEEFLAESGFDFTNVWTYVSDYDYPVLRCMVADKPVFKIIGTSLSEGTLNATVQVSSSTEKYTVIIGVYNERNQLIGVKRIPLAGAELAKNVNVSFDNMDKAHHIAVSAIDASTLAPLFEGIRKDI